MTHCRIHFVDAQTEVFELRGKQPMENNQILLPWFYKDWRNLFANKVDSKCKQVKVFAFEAKSGWLKYPKTSTTQTRELRGGYKLVEYYSGGSFFNEFDFVAGPDPTDEDLRTLQKSCWSVKSSAVGMYMSWENHTTIQLPVAAAMAESWKISQSRGVSILVIQLSIRRRAYVRSPRDLWRANPQNDIFLFLKANLLPW